MWLTPARGESYLRQALGVAGLLALFSLTPAAAEQHPATLTGQLLVAADAMPDPRFQKTVIYIVNYDEKGGALGLVVNQPLGDMPLDKLLNGTGADAARKAGQILARYGGPVEPSRAFLLLPPPPGATGNPAPAVVATLDNVISMIGDEDRPEQLIFTLGYAGWSPGQLEAEIATGNWDVIPFDEALVFGGEFEQMWARAVLRRATDL